MAKCVNKRCVLLNLVYNLALNNILCGVGTLFQGEVEELSGALIMIGLGVLLVVGVRKEGRVLLLTFLILEPFLLTYQTIKLTVEVVRYVQDTIQYFPVLNMLAIVGNVVCWVSIIPVIIIYKDVSVIRKEDVGNGDESKEIGGNELKTVVV